MRIDIAAGLTEMRSHWDSSDPQWRPGMRKYAFHLTMQQAPAVQQIAEDAHRALAGFEGLDPVETPWLHLTMSGLGATEQVTPPQLDAIGGLVFEHFAALKTPRVEFDHLRVEEEGVLLAAERSDWLMLLNQVQRDAIDEVLGAREWRDFWPHVSLAYCSAPTEASAVKDALGAVASGVPEKVEGVPTLTLMQLRRENHTYQWDIIREQAAG